MTHKHYSPYAGRDTLCYDGCPNEAAGKPVKEGELMYGGSTVHTFDADEDRCRCGAEEVFFEDEIVNWDAYVLGARPKYKSGYGCALAGFWADARRRRYGPAGRRRAPAPVLYD